MIRNFYSTDHAPYYIFALDYQQQSAGVRALHYLCHALNESGKEAYVTCEATHPALRTPVLNEATLKKHLDTGRRPIVVYPEIVSGDPFSMGGVVVRWLLNNPGHIGGETAFGDQELIFAYSPNFLSPEMRGSILHIPACDLSIFNNESNTHDESRDTVCFYAHKYLFNGGVLTEHVNGAVSLCKDQPLTHAEIAAILRRSKHLIVYEPTSLVVEALLCGCPVSIIETEYWRKHVNGFACGVETGVVMGGDAETLERARKNIQHYRTHYEDTYLKNAWIQLDRFIEVTQATAHKKADA